VEEGEVTNIENDLLVSNLNDKNFSSLAEELTVYMMGYTPWEPKHGYDGYLGVSYETSDSYLEVKPKKSYFNKTTNKIMNQLNGSGTFADYTMERYNKDIALGDKLRMVIVGFVEGEVAYIITFPFNHSTFVKKITYDVKRKTKKGVRPNADFGYTTYKDCKNVKIVYLASKERIDKKLHKYMSGPFLKFIEEKYYEE